LLYFLRGFQVLWNALLKKVQNYTLKVHFKQENGQTTLALKNIQQKLFYKVLAASLKLLITVKMAMAQTIHHRPMMTPMKLHLELKTISLFK
jgi:hypothetical protein